MIIIPSIASADPLFLSSEIDRVRQIGRLHLDFEDGNFVDNITFGAKTLSAISKYYDGVLDAHLMTTNPESYLQLLADHDVKAVCAHVEALQYPKRFLNHAHELNMQAGLAVNLKVPLSELAAYSDSMDYLLVMTSEPDFGSQEFFPCAIDRVADARSFLPSSVEIWCDGGINETNIKALYNAGMRTAVIGRAVFSSKRPQEYIDRIIRIVQE